MVIASMHSWFYWALLSAVFASPTAIFAKIGLDGIDSDFATLIHVMVILCAIGWFVCYTCKWRDLASLNSRRRFSSVLSWWRSSR